MTEEQAVALHVRESGREHFPPLVILHGFLGSARNWGSVGRKLGERFRVLAVDLRNHGRSPHAESMTFADSVSDLEKLFEDWELSTARVMGHSLGGKVAMRFACEHPDLVEELYVLDIAPRRYEPETEYIHLLSEIDLEIMDRRSDADDALSDLVEDDATRAFLLTNLRRDDKGDFFWLPNLEVLEHERAEIAAPGLEEGQVFEGPTHWIVGGASDYVEKGDEKLMRHHFPNLEKTVLEGVGHNVHIEGGERFLELI